MSVACPDKLRPTLGRKRGSGEIVQHRVFLCILLSLSLLTACDGNAKPTAEPKASPSSEAPESFERISKVKPPALKTQLAPERIQRCLYKEKVDPASFAGVYFSPQDVVAGQVETSRELQFDAPTAQLLDAKSFAKTLGGISVEVEEDDEVATKALAWALGVTPHGQDLNRFLRGEGSGLVAGFYNPRNGSIFIEEKGKLDSEYVVMAHEFTHAATDQAFGLPFTKVEAIIDDLSLSRSSLVEGDASLTELRVLSRLSPPHLVKKAVAQTIAFKDKFAEDRGAGIPYLLIDNALFPYQWGLSFACTVYKAKGWKGINHAYRKPPVSSAQVLFPERYLARERPMRTAELKNPGQLWSLRDTGQIGASHLKALFEAPGDKEFEALSRPVSRASAWGGGTYKIWTVGSAENEYVVGLSFKEHPDHDGLLCSSMNEWYRTAFKDAKSKLVGDRTVEFRGILQDAILICEGDDVLMGLAPNLSLIREVLSQG